MSSADQPNTLHAALAAYDAGPLSYPHLTLPTKRTL